MTWKCRQDIETGAYMGLCIGIAVTVLLVVILWLWWIIKTLFG